MLVRYRKDYEKIAMGLLSLAPDLRNYGRFTDELAGALAADYPVFLWKDAEDNHFIAIAIVEEGADYVLLRRFSFTPSERSGKNVFALLTALQDRYPGKRLMGTLKTQPLITNWEQFNEH
ncbi:reductase [Limosilactobacillus antri]|uniref:reductase n=1 Tax=Limosilactobacillus antri TaxID=227943 RepID=UPI001F5831D0|nr:reductase [Limosilactobacillus antri]